MPFMDQMFYTCIITIVVIFMVSLSSCPTDDDPKAIKLSADMFKTDKVFNICAYIICILLAVFILFSSNRTTGNKKRKTEIFRFLFP